ncbi:MAG: SRPBCC family protein [Anaerolineae bacterium]|jgi:hypothetical protein|nr:SRPBCC family protein [Anaerolineae bacterium]
MPVIEHSITINRPLVDVFRAVADFNAWHTWQPGITTVNLTSGDPVRVGTMLTIVRGGTFINADVLDYQRNKLIVFQGVWGRFRFSRTLDFQSGSVGGREAVVKDKINLQTGWLFFWYAPLLAMSVRSQTGGDWASLKRQLENSGRSQP